MIFYRIRLTGLPAVRYAHRMEHYDYSNAFCKVEDYLEVTLVESGNPTYMCFADEMVEAKAGTLIGVMQDMDIKVKAPGKTAHRCVGVTVKYEATRFDSAYMTVEEIFGVTDAAKENFELLIPFNVLLGDTCDKVNDLMVQISELHRMQETGEWARVTAKWFELMTVLTRYTVKQLLNTHTDISPAHYRYAEKVKNYMRKHLQQKVSAPEIAKSIGISVNYLHKVFKSATGKTVSEYFNTMKLQAAVEYMQKNNSAASDAARYVGIEDVLYFSRLFKKHYGVSVTEFKKNMKNT